MGRAVVGGLKDGNLRLLGKLGEAYEGATEGRWWRRMGR